MGERSVARSLSVLENDGWISVMRRSRDHKGNSYKLVMEKLKSPATETGRPSSPPDKMSPEQTTSPATEAGEEHADVTCQPVQVTCQIRQSHLPNTTESPAKSASLSILSFNRPEPSVKNRPEPSGTTYRRSSEKRTSTHPKPATGLGINSDDISKLKNKPRTPSIWKRLIYGRLQAGSSLARSATGRDRPVLRS
jgi:hypothetical protein